MCSTSGADTSKPFEHAFNQRAVLCTAWFGAGVYGLIVQHVRCILTQNCMRPVHIQSNCHVWKQRLLQHGCAVDRILAEGAMTLPVTLSGGVLFAS